MDNLWLERRPGLAGSYPAEDYVYVGDHAVDADAAQRTGMLFVIRLATSHADETSTSASTFGLGV